MAGVQHASVYTGSGGCDILTGAPPEDLKLENLPHRRSGGSHTAPARDRPPSRAGYSFQNASAGAAGRHRAAIPPGHATARQIVE